MSNIENNVIKIKMAQISKKYYASIGCHSNMKGFVIDILPQFHNLFALKWTKKYQIVVKILLIR